MSVQKSILFTVTNDLNYDQRMIRICSSLARAGYLVTLTGRKLKNSLPLNSRPYQQKRIFCFFSKGFLFYAEYNIRLFFWILTQKTDCICAIDLDTILPCLLASKLKGSRRVYDAHELFCEMKEVVTRPSRYRFWKWIEKICVPQFPNGYTVCRPIAGEFKYMYGVDYEVIRNLPLKNIPAEPTERTEPFFIYQGAVNEGRCFETLIPAMQSVHAPLHVYGDGNFFNQTKSLIKTLKVEEKVTLKGNCKPEQLKSITPTACAGITLFENNGRSNYYSLANRYFDYIMAGIPQLCVDFPSYKEIQSEFEVALLIPDTRPETIAKALNLLLDDRVLHQRLQENCQKARMVLNWENEETKLIQFYQSIFG
jgi:glycosyltransferase involved in cell wall biosynthesis